MSIRALLVPGLIAALLSLSSCYQPVTQEGLACSGTGSCPDGQSCGLDGRCWSMPPDACTPGSCEEGFDCGADGECRPHNVQEVPDVDTRAYVGHVLRADGSADLFILGTLVSSRIVLTCKDCLGDAGPGDLLFAPQEANLARPILSITRHPSADLSALVLATPLSTSGLRLANQAPMQDSEYIAVVPQIPAGAALERYSVRVSVTSILEQDFKIDAPLCTAAGGPTFSSDGQGDLLQGIHKSIICSQAGSSYQDLRIDAFTGWIQQVIDDAEPETCAEADPSCPGECASFECTEASGEVTTSCEPDASKCESGEFCSADLVCQSCNPGDTRSCGQCGEQSCENGQWGACNGLPITLSCGSCGRNYCQLNGNYGGCVAVASLCQSNQTCDAQSGQYACHTVTCSTAGKNQLCELTGTSPPATVNAGTTWLTGSACLSGGCRSCTCNSNGTVSCGNGCIL